MYLSRDYEFMRIRTYHDRCRCLQVETFCCRIERELGTGWLFFGKVLKN